MRQHPMRVRMLLFGQLKEAAGFAEQSIEMFEGDSVEDLLKVVRSTGVCPVNVLAASAVAVNREYVQPTFELHEGDEVAILPPVSGGNA